MSKLSLFLLKLPFFLSLNYCKIGLFFYCMTCILYKMYKVYLCIKSLNGTILYYNCINSTL